MENNFLKTWAIILTAEIALSIDRKKKRKSSLSNISFEVWSYDKGTVLDESQQYSRLNNSAFLSKALSKAASIKTKMHLEIGYICRAKDHESSLNIEKLESLLSNSLKQKFSLNVCWMCATKLMGSVRWQCLVFVIFYFIFPDGLGDGKEITTVK